MKNTIYFKSEEEMNNYYPYGIPSNVLAIVQPEGSEEGILFTTSNNNSATGTLEAQGGYNLDDENTEKLAYSYAAAQEMYANYATEAYVANYVSDNVADVDMNGFVYVSNGLGEQFDSSLELAYVLVDENRISAQIFPANSDFEGHEFASIGTVQNLIAASTPNVDLSAYVSKTELDAASYIATNKSIPFGKYLGIGNNGKIQMTSKNLNGIVHGVEFKEWLNQTTHAYINCINDNNIPIDNYSANNSRFSNKLFVEGDLYAYGIGGFASGTFDSSTMKPLSYVINDLQTQIANAGGSAEIDLSAYVTKEELTTASYATTSQIIPLNNGRVATNLEPYNTNYTLGSGAKPWRYTYSYNIILPWKHTKSNTSGTASIYVNAGSESSNVANPYISFSTGKTGTGVGTIMFEYYSTNKTGLLPALSDTVDLGVNYRAFRNTYSADFYVGFGNYVFKNVKEVFTSYAYVSSLFEVTKVRAGDFTTFTETSSGVWEADDPSNVAGSDIQIREYTPNGVIYYGDANYDPNGTGIENSGVYNGEVAALEENPFAFGNTSSVTALVWNSNTKQLTVTVGE